MSTLPLLPVRERRLHAANLTRLLAPQVALLGGFVSSQLVVVAHGARWLPDVAVVLADPPVDGVTAVIPRLVVTFGPPPPAGAWRALGVPCVWEVREHDVLVHQRANASVRPLGEVLDVPGLPGLQLPVVLALRRRRAR